MFVFVFDLPVRPLSFLPLQCNVWWDCTGGGGSNLNVGSYLSTTSMKVGLGVSGNRAAGICTNTNMLLSQVRGVKGVIMSWALVDTCAFCTARG